MRNPYITLLSTSWKYAAKERKKLLAIYGMFICANIVIALNPLLLGWFVNKAQHDTDGLAKYALTYIGCYVAMKLVEWSFHGPARVMERTMAFNLSRNFVQEKFHQTLHLTAKWHQDNHSGATINRIRKAYDALRGFFDCGFTFIHTFSKFVFSVTAIIIFSPIFGSIAVALGIFTVFVISKFDKPFIKTLKKLNKREHEVNSNLFDTISNIRTVITLRLERSMENGLLSKLQQVYKPFRKNAVINEWKWFTAEMLITLIYAVVVFGYIYQNWQPGAVFYIAGLVTLLGYVSQFTSVFHNVASQYTGLIQSQTNIEEVGLITKAYESGHRPDQPHDAPSEWKEMELSKINFSYRASYDEKHIPQSLHNLNIRLKKGNKIALIGQSGSGKSTLLSLMRGLYNPQEEAEFKVDGKTLPLGALNDWSTLFPQEPEIFENTLEYNVTLGLDCSEEEVRSVCDIAQLTDVIRQLPGGLRTDIREKGVNLSGGQKQRLALARGVLAAKDSQLILLDEPTSSVDPKTERLIYERMFRTFKNKAVISAIHRMHLLDQFDYIYLLDQGRILAEGTFEELLNESEAFRKLWEHQQRQVIPLATAV
jgi:ATP-binding cassette, subfamily B, bacterial